MSIDMAGGGCTALQDFNYTDDNQQQRPGAMEAEAASPDFLQQEKHAEGHHDCGTHQTARPAAIAIVGCCVSEDTVAARKQPASDNDQNDRPEAVSIEAPQAKGVE